MDTLRKMFSNRGDKVLLGLFIFMLVWLTVLGLLDIRYTIYNYIYSVLLALLPTIGAAIGFFRTKQWGGISSKLGRVTFFISLGLTAWSVASWVWTYYNLFLDIEVPYPSWADAGYMQVYWLWGIGIIALANLTAVKYNDRPLERILFFCIPVLMVIVTYYIIYVQVHSGESFFNTDNPLKLLVDIVYPLGNVSILTILILRSSLDLNYLGRRLRLPIAILVAGLVANYIADFHFSYSTTVGTYYVGATADWLFTISMFILSLGVSNLHPKLLKD